MSPGKPHSIVFVSSQYYEVFFLFKVEAEEANLRAQRQEKMKFQLCAIMLRNLSKPEKHAPIN